MQTSYGQKSQLILLCFAAQQSDPGATAATRTRGARGGGGPGGLDMEQTPFAILAVGISQYITVL